MSEEIKVENLMVEGRNAVIEAFRSGKPEIGRAHV